MNIHPWGVSLEDGCEVLLTPREAEVLNFVANAHERFISTRELAKVVYGDEARSSVEAIRVYITRIRQRVPGVLYTVYGHGYELRTPEECPACGGSLQPSSRLAGGFEWMHTVGAGWLGHEDGTL